ncbi:pre-mRNA-splicing factor Slu7-like isoform 1-T1 [Glossina fuscipes fuscipes]
MILMRKYLAWEAHDKGVDVHLLAEPTKLELLQKEYEKKKEQFKSSTKEHIVEKYGGEEHCKHHLNRYCWPKPKVT